MPPKAIFALISIKSFLISKLASTSTENEEPQSVYHTLLDIPKRGTSTKSTVRMRHARGGGAFQRSCQRKDWSSPVY
jgi:hypothetical protein